MFNSLYGHMVYNKSIEDVYFDEIYSFGGSENIALFANDMLELNETSVYEQQMPIIVKNVLNNAPMGNTVVPLYNYYGQPYGPEQYDFSGFDADPSPEIDYTDTLEDALYNLSWPNGSPTDLDKIYFSPDKNTILYCIIAYDITTNAYNTVNLTVKLAVATQNAVTGEIVDEQLFELPTITNLVVDLNWHNSVYKTYGLKLLGTNSYCVFLHHSFYSDIRVHLFLTLNADAVTVNGQSWQVLRNPKLHTRGQAKNNLQNWIGHIVIDDTTYVCVENRIEKNIHNFNTAVLAIDNVTNTIFRYICNYYFYHWD